MVRDRQLQLRQFKQCALFGTKLFIHLISLTAISFIQLHLIVLLSKLKVGPSGGGGGNGKKKKWQLVWNITDY